MCYLFHRIYYRYAHIIRLHRFSTSAHLFTCTEQINTYLMEHTDYIYNERYNEQNLSDCLISTQEDEDFADAIYESIQRKYNWLRQMEIM